MYVQCEVGAIRALIGGHGAEACEVGIVRGARHPVSRLN